MTKQFVVLRCASFIRPFRLAPQLACVLVFLLGARPGGGQPCPWGESKFWMPDGPVYSIVTVSNTVYLGGNFTYIGPRTGPAAVFDQATGDFQGCPSMIDGTVRAVVPDGHGGWYVGGSFTRIGQKAIVNLAHLNPDLSVDARWNARLNGSAVYALTLDENRLYIGGQFTRVAGQAVQGLVGLNVDDATVAWDPQLSGSVYAMKLNGGLLYVGGSFYSVGYSNIQNLAAISTDTALATAWNPAPDQSVLAIQISGGNVYVGGSFTTIGTKSRSRLAALDINSGVATTWNPNPNGTVRALVVTPTNAYVGGDFTTISVQNRRGFASIGLTGTGTAQPLDFQLQSPGTANLVRSILLDGNLLYVAGQFTGALGARHYMIVGLDVSSGLPLPTPMATDFNGSSGAGFGANAIAVADGKAFVGGDFQSMGGVARQNAAALSISCGAALPWGPAFSGPVLTLACGTNRIYAGGTFTNVNSTNFVQGLAAVDPVNGDVLPFLFCGTNASRDISVNALVATSNTLYVGGNFTVVGSQQRRFVAAVDPDSGALKAEFDAKLGGGYDGVVALAIGGPNLYIAGDFTSVNSVSTRRLAAVSAADGSASGWTPAPNNSVYALSATADTLYVGGEFTSINNGITLRNFAAYSIPDNLLMPMDAAIPSGSYGGVTAIRATPTAVYVSGNFNAIGGEFRQYLGCLNPIDATSFDWNPSPSTQVSTIAVNDEWVFLGGAFRSMGQGSAMQVNGFFTAFPRTPSFLSHSVDSGNFHLVTTTGDRTEAVLQSAPALTGAQWTCIATNCTPGFQWTIDVPMTNRQEYFRLIAR